MPQKNKQQIIDSLKAFKGNVDTFLKENNLKDLQASVEKLIKDAQKDLNTVIDKDIKVFKKKFMSEKKAIESLVNSEINKAKKFVATQKKEFTKLAQKLETLIPEKAKQATKKAKAKVAKKVVKKTSKKIVLKAEKVKAAKPMTTKKVTTKAPKKPTVRHK
jgi:hypothetical protein